LPVHRTAAQPGRDHRADDDEDGRQDRRDSVLAGLPADRGDVLAGLGLEHRDGLVQIPAGRAAEHVGRPFGQIDQER
jgi:hypothetical protein